MTDTPNGDPSANQTGQSPQPQATPAPAQTDNAAPSSSEPVDYLAGFRDAGGNLDADKIANELKSKSELQKLYGRQTNEVGDLRSKVERYDAFYQSEYVQDPDKPGQVIHKSLLNARKSQPSQVQPQGQLTQEEIDEQLRELMYDKPSEYNKLVLRIAKDEIMREIGERETVYTSPAARKIITDYPDVRPRAEQISLEDGIPLQRALQQAVGEKLLQIADGNAHPMPPAQPNINLGHLTTPTRTFMHPQGTTPQPQPKSNLTPEQIARGKEYGFTAEDLEPFANTQETR